MFDLLVPIDEIIAELHMKITDLEWDGEEDTGSLQRQLDRYIKDRDMGVVYEPQF